MRNLLFVVTLSFGCFGTIHAQNFKKPSSYEITLLPEWAQLMYSEHPSVYEVDALYRAFYQTNDFIKNYHTQYYKRWRRAALPYLNAQGFIIQPSAAVQTQMDKDYLRKQQEQKSSNWSVVGPITNFQEGQTQGSGQTNTYSFDQCIGTPNVCYCGTEPGEVYKSINAGLNWVCVSMTIDFGSGVTSVEVDDTNPNIVFAGGNKGVFRSVDGGLNWTNVLPNTNLGVNEIFILPSNNNVVFAATDKGLFKSSNGGLNWTQQFSDASYDIKANTGNSNLLYLVKHNGSTLNCEFLKSTDAGQNWLVQTTGWYSSNDPARNDGGARIAVTPADPNRVYAYLIGESKPNDIGYIGVFRSDDGGTTWTLPNGPVGGPYSASHINLAIGTDTWLYHQGFYNCAIMVHPTDPNILLVGGLNIYKSVDGGATFTALNGYVGGPLHMHVDNQDFRLVGNEAWITTDGGVYHSTDFFGSEPEFRMSGVHGSDFWGFGAGWNEDVLVGGLYHNGDLAYHENYGAGNFLELGGGEAATGYVNPGKNRLTYFSDIGGKRIPLNLSDPIAGAPFGNAPNESYYPAESSEMEFHPNCYGIAYIGKDHKLYKTTDAGASFTEVYTFGTNSGDQVKSIEIASSNPKVIYLNQQPASGNIGKIWKTSDGGQTWTSLTLPSGNSRLMLLSLNPLNENELWLAYVSGANGNKVFKTTDGGQTWTNLTTAILNNENVQSLVHIAGTTGGIYVATNKAVYYRTNTNPFVLDNAGLPTFISGNSLKPFYRDAKIRLASYGKGIFESALNEIPSLPICRITVDKLNLVAVCAIDSFYFDDYSFLNHTNASWNWTFPTGSPSSSTARNPSVKFSSAGDHLAILQITDAAGHTDIDSLTVNVSFFQLQTGIHEDFQTSFLPNGWSINNEDGGGTWSLSTNAGGYGNSSQAAVFNNYDINSQHTSDDLVMPLDASHLDIQPYLYFDVAYARWGSGYSDSLAVMISTDCGASYQQVYLKGGTSLATSPDNQSSFIPTGDQWRTDSVDLSAFFGQTNVQVAFRNIGGWGNNIYLDNINLGSMAGIQDPTKTDFSIYPNPIQSGSCLHVDGEGILKMKLISPDGKSLKTISNAQSKTIEIPENLSTGTYILQIETKNQLLNKAIVIIR
ncbi:MAG: VPS10 domain-containing protein [Flavobacteriales bacterium]